MGFDPTQYSTIDDLMTDPKGRRFGQEELNSTPLYVDTVRAMRFSSIGIYVLDNRRQEIGRYVSHNGPDGKITSIKKGFNDRDPSFTVKVNEKTLLEILERMDELKAEPLKSFFEYLPRFLPGRLKDYGAFVRLPGAAITLFKDAITRRSA